MTTQNIQLFERLEISIISEEVFQTLGIIQSIMFFVTIFTFSVLFYVVLFHSPKQIGDYKWHILANIISGFGFQTMSVILRPYPLLPYPVLVIRGVFDYYILIMGSMVSCFTDLFNKHFSHLKF
jgi:hypothetical protein